MFKSDPEMKKMMKDHFPGAMSRKEAEEPMVEEGADLSAQIMEEAAKLDEMAGKKEEGAPEEKGEEKGEVTGADKERVLRLLHNFGAPAEMSAADKGLVGPENFKKMTDVWNKMSPEERTECTEGGKLPMGAIASEGEPSAVMGKAPQE